MQQESIKPTTAYVKPIFLSIVLWSSSLVQSSEWVQVMKFDSEYTFILKILCFMEILIAYFNVSNDLSFMNKEILLLISVAG